MGAGTDLRTPSFRPSFAIKIGPCGKNRRGCSAARVRHWGTRNGVNRLFVGGQYSLQSKDAATWPT